MQHASSARFTLMLLAGSLASVGAHAEQDRAPQLDTRVARGVPVGHIYYNLSTGERIITPYEQRPRSASEAICAFSRRKSR